MKISILMVNFNTERFIAEFLEDLTQQSLLPSEFEIIITNNVQNNILAEMIASYQLDKKLQIQVIASSQNIGFGRAMNLASKMAKGEHFLIANPDLRMLQQNYLEQLYQNAIQHPNYGVMTTQLLNDKQEDKSEFYTFEFKETLGWKNQINWFSGALLLIRKAVFKQINGFDPDFFMYCEDEDLCLRIKQLNLPLIKLNELKIHHKGGASEPYQNYDYFYRWYCSQFLFAYKHFPQKKNGEILSEWKARAKKKIKTYQRVSFLKIPRYQFKLIQWQARLDVVEKIYQETSFLVNNIIEM